MLLKQRITVIPFRDFLKQEQPKNDISLHSFIPIHPAMFIDTTFIMIAGGIVLVALLERTLANNGHIIFAEAIHTFLKIAFPIVGLAAMYFLITQLHF